MEKEEIVKKFVHFLREKYYQSLLEAVRDGKPFLEIDFKTLDEFDTPLSEKLLYQPEDTLKIFEDATKEIDLPDTVEIKFRFRNLPEFACIPIRHLRSQHIGQFISVEGTVRRSSEILPEIATTIWTCPQCSTRIFLEQNERTMKKPVSCDCGYKGRFELFDKKLVDTRWISIEEPFEMTEGEKPSQLNVYLRDDLTSPAMRPKTDAGNRLRITGVLKEVTKVTQKGKRSVQLDILLAANHVETTEIEAADLKITPEDEQKIIELSKDPNIYEKIVDSVATSTYGLREIKEAIAYQLFSGVPHTMKDGTRVRGDVHILLIGEPSTGKSQLLKLVSRIANRGKYVSGKGASAVGLTASVMKDEQFSGGWVLEAGAIVLANKGLCSIDEFEKMHENDQVALHEAMEQQSYHPSTEIMLADGSKHKIGEFVDGLFEKNKDKIVEGINCEILPTNEIEVLTTDFKDIYPTKISRVSRHAAPKNFCKIKFSNGRIVLVTPEHPLFAVNGTNISTVPAEMATTGLCVPAPAGLPIAAKDTELQHTKTLHPREKRVQTPNGVTPELASVLGYYASEGHSFKGVGGYEVGFTNSSPYIINDIVSSMHDTFSIKPYVQARDDGVNMLRYSSAQLFRFFKDNFPEMLQKARKKYLPDALLNSPKESRLSFLRSAFLGDGFVDSERFGYCTASLNLAKGYQEMLLSIGIYSYITHDRSSDSYKVVISSTECMEIFLNEAVDSNDHRKPKMEFFVNRSATSNRKHELPDSVRIALKNTLSEFKLDDGSLYQAETEGCGITKSTIEKYLKILKQRISRIQTAIKTAEDSVKLRKACSISQDAVQKEFGINHATVSYIERKKHHKRKQEILNCVKTLALKKLDSANGLIKDLEALCSPNLKWLTITSVETVPNDGVKWVYDITVEPTNSFISECLILHNSVSVAKASIIATLPAQTAILAAANPKFGRFDFMKGIADQVTIPETLLSRFDLKFALFDVPDKEKDAKMAEHIMRSRVEDSYAPAEPLIGPMFLRKYIAYARKNCSPKMTMEVGEIIKKFYIDTRGKYVQRGPISITPRQYEALIRLAEASARIRLSPVVIEDDARRAIKLLQTSLQQLGLDKDTGLIDIDKIESGTSSSQRNKILMILDIVDALTKEIGKIIPVEDVLAAAGNEGINESDAMEVIERLKREGQLMEPKYKHLQKV